MIYRNFFRFCLTASMVILFATNTSAKTTTFSFVPEDYRIIKDAQGFDHIRMNGFHMMPSPGNPILPYRIYNVAVAPDVDWNSLNLEILSSSIESLPGGYYLKPGSPDTAWTGNEYIYSWGEGKDIVNGKNMEVYGEDSFFPSEKIKLIRGSQMRKWKFVKIGFSPFQYNPATGHLVLTKEIQIKLTYSQSGDMPGNDLMSDTVMDDMAQKMFINYSEAREWYTGYQPGDDQNASDYVIITTAAIVAGSTNLSSFISHKTSKGFSVTTVTEGTWGAVTGQSPNHKAEKIRQWLINNYVSEGIEYVLLIGDPFPYESGEGDVPMKMCWPRYSQSSYRDSPTDAFYSDLTGNWDYDADLNYGEDIDDYGPTGGVDFTPEVYVGRIPVYSTDYTALDNILQKTMDYENESSITWRQSALLPMSFSNTTYDGAPLAEQMKDDYLTVSGYSTWTQYQQGNGACSLNSGYSSNEELRGGTIVRDRWAGNDYGVVCWWGHGSSTSTSVGCSGCWDGTLFNSSSCSYLDDDHPSFTYQCSCTNGYPENTGNLGYSILEQGGIGTVTASRVSWYNTGVGYGDFDGSTTNSGIGYEYIKRLVVNEYGAGKALCETKGAMLPEWSTRLMNFYDFNLYGDPSTSIADFLTHSVTTPNTPSGTTNGQINTSYTYTTGGSTCSEGHDVEYRFDWDDGSYSTWSSSTSASHAWTSTNTYSVKAQARCAVNNAILSPESTPLSVTIVTCLSPSTPSGPSPANGAIQQSINTDLNWADCTNTDSYDVYFGTAASPPFHTNTTSSNVTLAPLSYDTTYYWYVIAKNSCAQTTGPTWSFKTKAASTIAQRLTYTTGAHSKNPAMARWNNNVYVVWKEGNLPYFRRNTNSGSSGSWNSAVKMATWGELDAGENPVDIAAYGNYVYAAMSWRPSASDDYEIYVKRSTDQGNTWDNWFRLTYNAGESCCPSIAGYAGCVYVVWQDDNPGNSEIFFKKSASNGAAGSWSAVTRTTYNSGASLCPQIAAGGAYVHLTWYDNTAGNAEVYHKVNSNWGASGSWSAAWRLTYNTGFSSMPGIVCDSTGQNVHIVWSDNNPGNYEIFHKANSNYGAAANWSTPIRVCYSSGTSRYPDVDMDGAVVDIAWCDNNPGNWEIYRKTSTDNGISFGTITRYTYNSGLSYRPKVKSDTGSVLWDDDNPGNKEIFYK